MGLGEEGGIRRGVCRSMPIAGTVCGFEIWADSPLQKRAKVQNRFSENQVFFSKSANNLSRRRSCAALRLEAPLLIRPSERGLAWP